MSIRSLTENEIQSMQSGNIWSEDCPLHHSRLRVVEIKYFGFDDYEHSSTMIVLDSISEQVKLIFEELFSVAFPIYSIVPMEQFKGDDVASMEANNSSAFNGRRIMNTDRWSSHAYGCAIDINPAQNPYMLLDKKQAKINVFPSSAIDYVNRNSIRKGMVEPIVQIFEKHGFTDWGGGWVHKPDYHHFQLPWESIHKLV
ncbi:MAG: M15 family peptidase [Balneola sp.]|nr:MAG: M15 family peptidase [Balneola sp.]